MRGTPLYFCTLPKVILQDSYYHKYKLNRLIILYLFTRCLEDEVGHKKMATPKGSLKARICINFFLFNFISNCWLFT